MLSPETGLFHTSDSASAIAARDMFQSELLIYGNRARVILEAPDHDPQFAEGLALAAALHLFTLSPAGHALAAPLLAAANAAAPSASKREQHLVAGIGHWAGGRIEAALLCHLEIARHWPEDLVSARLALFHQLNRGDFPAMLALTGALVAALPGNSHVLGMHAFALEQTGSLDAAERAGRAAADAGFDPWAEHAVAHVLDSRGASEAGSQWMAGRAAGWDRCSSFLYTHNWWHAALFHIDLGNHPAALALYDSHVWGVRKAYAQDQVNAVSLLARLEMRGVAVGNRWEDLSAWLEPRTAEHVNGFLDLHYLYGMARGGRDGAVAAMQASLKQQALAATDEVWRSIVPLAGEGLVAHARGRHARAADCLGRVRHRLLLTGGSHTQRDLFDQMWIDSLSQISADAALQATTAVQQTRGRVAWASRLCAGFACAPALALAS